MSSRRTGRCSATLVGLTLCAVSPARAAEQSVLLKPRYVPGRTSYVEMALDFNQKITGSMFGSEGTEATIRQLQGVWEKTESLSAAEGARITMTFDRVQLTMLSAAGSLSFDSDLDDPVDQSNALAPLLRPMLGMPMTLEVDKDGRIVSFRGMRSIVEKIEKSVGPQEIFSRLKNDFTDEAAKILWAERRLMLYPNREVSVGDTWQYASRVRGPLTGDRVCEYNFHLKGIEEKGGRLVAEIGYTGTIRTVAGAEPGPAVLGHVELKSGTVEGAATFDIERGQYVRQTDQTHVVMEIEGYPGADDASSKAQLEQHINQTITVMTEVQRRQQKNATRKTADAPASPPPK